MACFLAPVAEAIVLTAIKHSCKKKEEALSLATTNGTGFETKEGGQLPFSQKLGWLTNMLWGGSFLLAIEHIWHGEIVPWAPFLTAMNNPAAIQPMLMEIATAGVTMAVLVTAIWGVMVFAVQTLEKKAAASALRGGTAE